jgi:hypothetical protein
MNKEALELDRGDYLEDEEYYTKPLSCLDLWDIYTGKNEITMCTKKNWEAFNMWHKAIEINTPNYLTFVPNDKGKGGRFYRERT